MGAMLSAVALMAGSGTGMTAGSIMSGVSAVSGVTAGLAGLAQGINAQRMEELNAQSIELQGRLDATKTNEELLKTLAYNNVAAVASGLQSAGSVQYAQQEAQAKAAEELKIQRLNTKAGASSARASGAAAKTQGLFDLAGSGITAGDRVGNALKIKKKTTG